MTRAAGSFPRSTAREERDVPAAIDAPDSFEDAKQAVVEGEVDVLLVLPRELAEAGGPPDASAYVKDKQSITAEQALRGFLLDVVRDVRLAEYELPPEILDTVNARLELTTVALTESGGEAAGSAAGSMAVGLGVGVVMLMVMWIWGSLLIYGKKLTVKEIWTILTAD